MTKQEKIQEAYGEHWETVKESVNPEDGWCTNELFQDDDGDIIVCPCCKHIFNESKIVYCINSLERCPNCNGHVSQYEYHHKFINFPDDAQKRFGEWRSKSLQGIENNNGWIKIESEDDLPKEKEFFRFIPCNNFDMEFIGWIDKKLGEVLFIDFTFYEVEKDGNRYISQSNAWLTSQITHYQPIQKTTTTNLLNYEHKKPN